MTADEQHLEKATKALRSGNTASAYFALKRILKRSPGHPHAVLLMARVHLFEGKLPEAAWLAHELVTREPFKDEPTAATELADVCMHCELWFDAANLYNGLCDLTPADESLRYRAGRACYQSGQIETALQHFEKCAEIRPEHPASYLQLGHINRALRHFDTAAEHYQAYLARSTDEKAAGYWSLSDLRRFSFSRDMVAEMQQYSEAMKENDLEASVTHFALGIAAEQASEFETAYHHFAQANGIQARLRPFRADAFQKLTGELLASQSAAETAETPARPRPIFIVGLPRSGTTLVEQILAAHSGVAASDELPYMERIAFELERSGGYGKRLAALSEEEVSRYRARYLREAGQHLSTEAPCFIDKNPNNFLHIGLIRRLLPEALVINLQRDLRDNAISIFRQHFSVGHDYSSRFEDIESYMGGYLEIMGHWLELYPERIRVQAYEELVQDPDGQIAALLEFCGLGEERACFEFYRSSQTVTTPSAGQVSLPMYTSSIGRWRQYEQALSEEFARLDALNANARTRLASG